ncbi:MAG TPA: FAD-dependent oxidoreductase [Actinomycetes bacterium]|nr:FAD-dependent oxidoreductase [Actinomycetes bacterium]
MTRHRSSQPVWVDDPDGALGARSGLPVVVIGAGPVGLAAAAHLLDRGLEPLVLEAGPQVGANLAQWRHVRLFSPWCLVLDPVSVRLLDQAGWTGPDPDALPTGADLLERYLQPLAALPALASRIRLRTTVVAVARHDLDKVRGPGRDQLPFLVRVRDRHGRLQDLHARAVIDASGTWTQPNPLGASGLPALGEADAGPRIAHGLPDVLGADRDRYAGRRTVVVGAGHSAATSLLALGELQQQAPTTEVVWVVRSATPRPLVGKGSAEADELPARGQLATDLAALVDAGRVELVTGFRISAVESTSQRLRLVGDRFLGDDLALAHRLAVEADEVVAATGFRPDHTIAAELRLALEPALESAAALGPLIDPNVHTCGTVPAHGIAELAHPEPGYVVVGMKSYGRAPTFLLATGYQQVRSVVAALAGDRAGASRRDQGPPAAAICASNRTLLADAHRLTAAVAKPTGAAALGTAADWSAATCC